jgi:hypothetical protein
MPEVMFVLKAFVIALVVTIFMQVKIGQNSIENHAHEWMQTSAVPVYIEGVSAGAVLAVKNAAKVTTDFVAKTFGHDPSSQRAGRLNLEFKRSPRVQESHPEHDSADNKQSDK